jgi:hypothetical protein
MCAKDVKDFCFKGNCWFPLNLSMIFYVRESFQQENKKEETKEKKIYILKSNSACWPFSFPLTYQNDIKTHRKFVNNTNIYYKLTSSKLIGWNVKSFDKLSNFAAIFMSFIIKRICLTRRELSCKLNQTNSTFSN